MTGPEVTAAMKAEDVPAEWVEKAVQARYDIAREGSGTAWSDLPAGSRAYVMRRHGAYMRHALAAVLPEIQAQALERMADLLSADEPTNSGLIGPIGLQDLANDLRAGTLTARLTATTEEPTS